MEPGDLVAGRFEIVSLAGAGGMGRVFRAYDRQTERPVALKVLTSGAIDDSRFVRESDVLRRLSAPNIVRHVAQGRTAADEPFLAMEWVEGEDLCARLSRGALSVEEALRVARSVASALSEAHRHGVIHRDVKPSNVMLPSGDLGAPKLTDFGVAHVSGASVAMTMTGELLGTPSYMAPEQARGERSVDARVDVFALGCVLYECLTGAPAFAGQHLRAVLAKILFDEAPRVSWTRRDIDPAVDRLVTSMTARDPELRVATADAVIDAIDGILRHGARVETAPDLGSEPVIGDRTREWVYIVTALRDDAEIAPDDPENAATVQGLSPELRVAAGKHGGDLQVLHDGTVFVLIRARGSAEDQAAVAARCALELRLLLPDVQISVCAAHASTGASPIGPLVERAVSCRGERGRVCVDDHVASMLDARFRVASRPDGRIEVLHEDPLAMQSRRLLGRATPTVGRERELAMLRAVLDEVATESVALAVLVTGLPGVGKSRIRHELLTRVGGFDVWSARADAMSAGAPLLVVSRLLRSACAISDGDPPDVRWTCVREAVHAVAGGADAHRLATTIGVLAGAPPPDRDAATADLDAVMANEATRAAWVAFVEARCRVRPVLLAIEDLHWGDHPSIKLVDAALRRCKALPLAVLAFARPELETTFPRLWEGRALQHVRLGELSPRACERLIRHALGEVAPETVAHVVRLSGGNAFYLEELIRATASGGSRSGLPQTVVASVQARLDRLEKRRRRVLQVGSVFGETFSLDGVRVLLPIEERADAGRSVDALVEDELLEAAPVNAIAAEPRLRFRHALVREAAYGSLEPRDAAAAHHRAADWLESAGQSEPFVLAEHLERAGLRRRAVPYYLQAARQALRSNDLETVAARCERARVAGAEGLAKSELLATAGEALVWKGEVPGSASLFDEALGILATNGPSDVTVDACATIAWAALTGTMAGSARYAAIPARAADQLVSMRAPDYPADYFRAAALTVSALYFRGDRARGDAVIEKILPLAPCDRRGTLWRAFASLLHARFAQGDPWRARAHGIEGIRACSVEDDAVGHAHVRTQCALSELSLGAHAHANENARVAHGINDRFRIEILAAMNYGVWAVATAGLGELVRTHELVDETLRRCTALGDDLYGGYGRLLAARALRTVGAPERAISECRRVLSTVELHAVRLAAEVQLAASLVEVGEHDEALALCIGVVSASRTRRLRGELETDLLSALVRSSRALGNDEVLGQALVQGRGIVDKRLASITDPAIARGYRAFVEAAGLSPSAS